MEKQRSQSRWVRVSAVVCMVGASFAVGGCGMVQDMLSAGRKPTVGLKDVRFQDISFTDARMLFDLQVSNPYSLPMPLTDAAYRLTSGGRELLRGEDFVGGIIPARQARIVTVPMRVDFANVLDVLKNVRAGSVIAYTLEGNLKVEPPELGEMRIPIRTEGEMPVPASPDVSLDEIRWGEISMTDAQGTLVIEVTNRNEFTSALRQVSYALQLSGREIATATTAATADLAAGETGTVEVPVRFSPSAAGAAVLSILRGQSARYTLAGNVTVDTPFGEISLPYSHSGEAPMRR